jgi:prepilin-type N-terminal cleavage/methylation domain-containing protein
MKILGHSKSRTERGFSLIELMIATLLFTTIAGITFATDGVLIPYLDNVMNNPTAAQMAFLKTTYPAMFPGNAPVPVFTYTYDTGAAPQPANIREVNITLIVQSPRPDPQNNRLRVVTLTGQALRINPNQ